MPKPTRKELEDTLYIVDNLLTRKEKEVEHLKKALANANNATLNLQSELDMERRITSRLMTDMHMLRIKHKDFNPQYEIDRMAWYCYAHNEACTMKIEQVPKNVESYIEHYINYKTVRRNALINPVMEVDPLWMKQIANVEVLSVDNFKAKST